MSLLLGSHVGLGGKDQYLGSVKEALSYGANVFMVYTGAPQNSFRKPVREMRIPEAIDLMRQNGIDPASVIVHAPYIVNLANPDPEKRAFAVSFLTEEVMRTSAMGAKTIVLHPGAHMKDGPEAGIERIADGVKKILAATASTDVAIALEGMAGKGTEVGRSFDELGLLLALIGPTPRVGVCFDTCHTHDAGYDVIDDFEATLDVYDKIVGVDRILVLHVNDSKNERGAHKDRHANIGFGQIGFAALSRIVHHPRFETIPKILETPYVPDETNPALGFPPYKFEIAMLRENAFDPDVMAKIRTQEAKEEVGD
ncbi:MAG TPA: deoxyribonuclease IV [Acholeplasmatales bacterium]|nr:MAG: deoxyribonuclease IV [Tenericutes bacterium GWF2_57_13]HAQ55914.1 deoxyribonuclease IV [Acholeplasmatales bacterium]